MFKVRCTATKCGLSTSEYVLVHDDHQNVVYRPVRTTTCKDGKTIELSCSNGATINVKSFRYFTYRKLTYLWHIFEHRFVTTQDLEANVCCCKC